MDTLILYCAFSYLFMFGFGQEFEYRNNTKEVLINLFAPVFLPVLIGKVIGSGMYHIDPNEDGD